MFTTEFKALSLQRAMSPRILMLPLLFWAMALPAYALELDGKTMYQSLAVKNQYAGSILEIRKQEGAAVAKDEAVALYRLAPQEIESIRTALDDINIREKNTQINNWEARVRQQTQLVEQLQASVNAGYASPLRLESEKAALDLYQSQLREAQLRRADLVTSLAAEQKRISENFGNLKVSRDNIPAAIPLSAPFNGVLSKMTLQVGQKIAAKTDCFKVTTKAIFIKTRAYADEYQHLHTGDHATVTIQGFPDQTFSAVLFLLPLKPVDKGSMALSYYEVLFHLLGSDVFVREGLSARVTVP